MLLYRHTRVWGNVSNFWENIFSCFRQKTHSTFTLFFSHPFIRSTAWPGSSKTNEVASLRFCEPTSIFPIVRERRIQGGVLLCIADTIYFVQRTFENGIVLVLQEG